MAKQRSVHKNFKSGTERRGEIVEAAFQCIKELGYARVTARKIAEYGGASLGHITYHFKDMNAVLNETYRYAADLLVEASLEKLAHAPEDALSQLEHFLRASFTADFLEKGYVRVRIDLWSAALTDPEIASTDLAICERYRHHLNGILRKIAQQRGVENTALDRVSDPILSLLDGLWLDWQRRKDNAAVEHGLQACLALVNAFIPVRQGVMALKN